MQQQTGTNGTMAVITKGHGPLCFMRLLMVEQVISAMDLTVTTVDARIDGVFIVGQAETMIRNLATVQKGTAILRHQMPANPKTKTNASFDIDLARMAMTKSEEILVVNTAIM
jgi:hypothetical protein